jgi:arylsulfatase A-like enzyme
VADEQIGRIIDAIEARGLADDTLIVITGDHGEAFGSPHETYGHGTRVYQECLNVPFVLWNPKLLASGARRSEQVGGLVDLGATILDVLGIAEPGEWQGRSLLDGAHPQRTYFSAATDGYLLALRQERWKYVFNATIGREELFDLSVDGRELNNIAREHKDVADACRGHLSAWLDSQRRRYGALQR